MVNHLTLRVMLVDDHPMFREGLRSVIQQVDGYSVVAEAETIPDAKNKLEMTSPDLVITDLQLGNQSGRPLIEFVAALERRTPILVMSNISSRWDVLGAIEAGAGGYLTKGASRDEVITALREVSAGRNYLHPQVAHVVFEKVRTPHGESAAVALTSRESELLELLGKGNSPQYIADQLHLAPSTVKTHIRSLFRKFEVCSRTQLILKAIKMELIVVRQ